MGTIDISNAERPIRKRAGGADTPLARHFWARFPPAAKRYRWITQNVLYKNRESPVNETRTEIDDPDAVTATLKASAHEMGADIVGVAAYDPRLSFADAAELDHTRVIVYGIAMAYDTMIDIGPRSQEEVHRVYYRLDDLGVRLANQIGAFGYSARMQPNGGEIPLVAYGQLAGLGELGKHGSLISPELGSSFRLGAVTTNMPLSVDGPKDHGIDEICANCRVCERFCPGDAIKPEKKTVNGVTRWYVDTPACEPHFLRLYGCKLCLMVCPFNARGVFKEQFAPVARDIRAAKSADGLLRLIEERTDLHLHDFEAPPPAVKPMVTPSE